MHSPMQVEVVDRPASVASEDARRVGIVDVDDGIGLLGGLDDLGKPRDVAVHAEDAVGDDQDGPIRIGPAHVTQRLAQRFHVGVREDPARRPS